MPAQIGLSREACELFRASRMCDNEALTGEAQMFNRFAEDADHDQTDAELVVQVHNDVESSRTSLRKLLPVSCEPARRVQRLLFRPA